jgi:hypothetical protein
MCRFLRFSIDVVIELGVSQLGGLIFLVIDVKGVLALCTGLYRRAVRARAARPFPGCSVPRLSHLRFVAFSGTQFLSE